MHVAGGPRLVRARGFTLIELLVVIAIIAILAAILFPVFAQAKDSAQQSTCLSNAKQLATGLRLYMDDFDSVFPGAGCVNGRGWVDESNRVDRSGAIKNGEIYPYVKNEGVYACSLDAFRDKNVYSYSLNVCMQRRIETSLEWPATTVLMVEENEETAGGSTGLNDGCFYPHIAQDQTAIRHRNGGHFIYGDTHVKWHNAEDFIWLGLRGPRRIGKLWHRYDAVRPIENERRPGRFTDEMCFEDGGQRP